MEGREREGRGVGWVGVRDWEGGKEGRTKRGEEGMGRETGYKIGRVEM